MKATIVIPTYNESKNVRKMAELISKVDKTIKILFVDDNSPDGTGKILDAMSKKEKGRIFVMHRPKKMGLGSAYIQGFKHVLKNIDADLIFSMDSDLSHSPKYIPRFIKKINEGYDVVVGSRYISGGGVNWGFHRTIMSWGANTVSRIFLGLKIHDVTTGYRCYKREVLEKLDLDSVKSNGFSFQEEMLYLCKINNFRIGEIPIFFVERQKGKSKLSYKEVVKFFITILRLRFFGSKPKK